jgi:hypothetical protein
MLWIFHVHIGFSELVHSITIETDVQTQLAALFRRVIFAEVFTEPD